MTKLRERLTWARAQKSARDGAEFTQEALAVKAGVTQGAIAHLESGRTESSREIVEIAYVLGVNARWLVYGRGEPFPEDMPVNSRSHLGGEQLDSKPSVPPNRPEASLATGLRLLMLFNGTDEDGRGKIMRAAERMPQVHDVSTVARKG